MANQIGNLVVKLEAQKASFDRNIKGARKTLKNFSDDAAKRSAAMKKGFNAIAVGIKAIAKAALAGVGAATAFFAAITIKAGTIKAIKQLSDVTGVAVENLQKWNIAAKTVGIDSDKMGDIFSDAAEKLGELAATGGGEAKEVFEKLGLDASKFVNMPIDQALLKIASRMDGLTKNERNAFFEMLASDARELIPLLENNAAKLTEIGKRAERLGLILSGDAVNAAAKFSKSWGTALSIANGFFSQLTGSLAPALDILISKFVSWIEKIGGVEVAANKMAKGIVNVTISIVKGITGIAESWDKVMLPMLKVKKVMLEIAKALPYSPVGLAIGSAVDSIPDELKKTVAEIDKIKTGLNGKNEFVESLESLRSELESSIGVGVNVEKAQKDSDQETKKNTSALSSLTRQLAEQNKPGQQAWDKIFGTNEKGEPIERKISSGFASGARELKQQIALGYSDAAKKTAEELQKRIDQTISSPGGLYNMNTGFSTGRLADTDVEGMQNVLNRLLDKMGEENATKNLGRMTINMEMNGQEIMSEVVGTTESLTMLHDQFSKFTEDKRRAAVR